MNAISQFQGSVTSKKLLYIVLVLGRQRVHFRAGWRPWQPLPSVIWTQQRWMRLQSVAVQCFVIWIAAWIQRSALSAEPTLPTIESQNEMTIPGVGRLKSKGP